MHSYGKIALLMQGHNRKNLGRAKGQRRLMTKPERLVWMNLRGSEQGVKFRRQVPIANYILDFYCPAARLCIEIDGPHHMDQVAKDHARDEALADRLILTIRFSSEQVKGGLDWVIDEILKEAKRRIAYFERERKPNIPEE